MVTGNLQVMGIIVCTGLMWLEIRYRSGFCKLIKEASSSTTGRQNIQIFQNDTDRSRFQS